MSSISQAVRAFQRAGHHLESDGEGLWRVDGQDWFDNDTFLKRALDLPVPQERKGEPEIVPRRRDS